MSQRVLLHPQVRVENKNSRNHHLETIAPAHVEFSRVQRSTQGGGAGASRVEAGHDEGRLNDILTKEGRPRMAFLCIQSAKTSTKR